MCHRRCSNVKTLCTGADFDIYISRVHMCTHTNTRAAHKYISTQHQYSTHKIHSNSTHCSTETFASCNCWMNIVREVRCGFQIKFNLNFFKFYVFLSECYVLNRIDSSDGILLFYSLFFPNRAQNLGFQPLFWIWTLFFRHSGIIYLFHSHERLSTTTLETIIEIVNNVLWVKFMWDDNDNQIQTTYNSASDFTF